MLGILLIAAQAAVATPGPTPGPVSIPRAVSAKRTVQQDFDAATALQDAGNHAEALAAWEALEKRIPNNKRSLAIISVRKSTALIGLSRDDEAVAVARAGLAGLPANDPTLQEDRFRAWANLARIAEVSLDYASAADAYRRAEAIAPNTGEHIAVFRGLIDTEVFTDPDAAARDMARAEAFIAPLTIEARSRAILKRVKSQLLLNQGNYAAAQAEAGESVKLLGGLTSKTDLYDVASRSNYAIAALLAGKTEEARRYMAMTGAGRLSKGSFDPGSQMKVPDCGGEGGLKPDDVAVVEFSVADDGVVHAAYPVYAAGGGAVALEFARAARGWSFNPQQMKEMPAFFRARARVELRCSTAFTRPSIDDYLNGELVRWLMAKKVPLPAFEPGSDAAAFPKLKAEVAKIEATEAPNTLTLVPLLYAIAQNAVATRDESYAAATRALSILDANGAKGTARMAVDHLTWAKARSESWRPRTVARTTMAALSSPAYADNAEALAAGRLMLADTLRSFDETGAVAVLEQVGSNSGLPTNHPLRVGALIRLASLEQARGDINSARTAFERSGLSANQCALLDAPPKRVSVGGSFPDEARMWGFEGWTQVQYDIAADGKVLNERAVVSYPPFIFTKAGRQTMASARYEKSYRPDGGLGCGGTSQRVRFTIEQ
jgi:tetratricopeptide (TPR) repeat protein